MWLLKLKKKRLEKHKSTENTGTFLEGAPDTKLYTSRMLITLKEPVTWPLRKLDSPRVVVRARRVRGRKMSTMEVQEKRVEVR